MNTQWKRQRVNIYENFLLGSLVTVSIVYPFSPRRLFRKFQLIRQISVRDYKLISLSLRVNSPTAEYCGDESNVEGPPGEPAGQVGGLFVQGEIRAHIRDFGEL